MNSPAILMDATESSCRLLHFSDMAVGFGDVRYRGQSGSRILVPSGQQPKADIGCSTLSSSSPDHFADVCRTSSKGPLREPDGGLAPTMAAKVGATSTVSIGR